MVSPPAPQQKDPGFNLAAAFLCGFGMFLLCLHGFAL